MRDPYDSGSLAPILALIVMFVVAKVLVKAGLLKRTGVDRFAKGTGVLAAIAYMASFTPVKSFGPVIDFVVIGGTSAILGVVVFYITVMAAGGATDDE